jgi:anaerobic dimethyl sulfoxide reductase subunit B (iron-sulfur subunit)
MNEQFAFYFDQTKCMACNTCVVACKDWNQINPGPVARRKQFTYEVDTAEGMRYFPFSNTCNHCDEPACVAACAYGAISKDTSTGIVTIHRDLCQGLRACISACPFAKPMMADDKQEPRPLNSWQIQHPAQKCTMCLEDRLNNGLKPACVMSCVGRAMDWGTVDYINTTYGSEPGFARLNATDFPYLFVNNSNDTGPNLYVKKMPPNGGQKGMKVHKSSAYTGKSQ